MTWNCHASVAKYSLGKFIDVQIVIVCSLTLTFFDDVATIPQCQRKGYATELLLTALCHAQSLGYQYCFLEASSSGLSVYERIGFRELFKSHYYETKPIKNGVALKN